MTKAQPRINHFVTLFNGSLLAAALVWIYLRTSDWVPKSFHAGSMLNSLLAGVGVAVIVVILSAVLMRHFVAMRRLANVMRETLGPIDAKTAAWLAITSSVGEELFFRGAMQPALGYVATSLFLV